MREAAHHERIPARDPPRRPYEHVHRTDGPAHALPFGCVENGLEHLNVCVGDHGLHRLRELVHGGLEGCKGRLQSLKYMLRPVAYKSRKLLTRPSVKYFTLDSSSDVGGLLLS